MPDINLRNIMIAGALIGGIATGLTVGAVVWLGPHVWNWFKPILHTVTA